MRVLLSSLIVLSGLFAATVVLAEDEKPAELAVTSTNFADGMPLPVMYTCDGKNVAPDVTWANLPAKTKSLALIVSDPDAPDGTFYHWVVFNIPAKTTEIPEGTDKLPQGALAGKNSFGKTGYGAPCPPKGSIHNYVFTVYALDTTLSLPAGADAKQVLAAIKGHSLKEAKITAVYARWNG